MQTKINEQLKKYRNCIIERLFLIVYPPLGEDSFQQIDMRLGIVLKGGDGMLLTLSTDIDDIWSPVLMNEKFQSTYYSDTDFSIRIKMWMEDDPDLPLILEYFDFTNSHYFSNISQNNIKEIQLLHIENNHEPFGVKLLFEKDYLLSYPNSDGNTIETKDFNKNDGLTNFEKLGKIIYSTIKDIDSK